MQRMGASQIEASSADAPSIGTTMADASYDGPSLMTPKGDASYDASSVNPPRDAASVDAPVITSASFPLAVSANGRYLIDKSGAPFRLQTDAAWVMVAHASDADVTTYLSRIKSLGFTGFILMNIVHKGGPGWPNLKEPADYYGNQPFTTPDALDTPNPTYFARVSGVIDQALALGLYVELFHTYVGGDGGADGWESVITNGHNTDAICFNWGVYLGNTFKQPNIIWMHGGDHNLAGTALSRFQQIVAGIHSVTRNRIAGAEWKGPDSILTDQPGFTYGPDPAKADMQLNSFYGGGPNTNGQAFTTASRSWLNTPALPAEIQEPDYEDAWYAPAIAARQQVRATYHWAVTAGAIAGGTVGAKYRWDWQVTHDPLGTLSTSPVTLDALESYAFYRSIPWHRMVPSGVGAGQAGRILVVAGAGAGNSTITSSVTDDGSVLLAYVPSTGAGVTTFSVDLRSMKGASRGRWWNPTSGAYTAITGDAYTLPSTSAAQSFMTPGNNGTGFNDWMLVVDAK